MATFNAQGHSVVVEVSPDIHICGFCKQQYNNFEVFRAHKQNGCSIPTSDISASTVTSSLTDSSTEFVFEQTYQTSQMKGVKKLMTKAQKTPSKKLKPALTSKRHSCCFSGCTFNTQYGQKDMERHLKTHTGEKPFECELCHKRFSRRDKLNMHSRLHTGEKPHKCKHCAYAAADSSSLKKHLRIHYDERPFKCQICPYASRNSSQLTVHLRSHTGDAPFQCQQCDAKFKINSDLKRHVRIHSGEKPYKCDFCEYRCAMKGNLKSHVQIKHGTANAFRCPHCDFQCANKTALRQHSREHQPIQPMQCAKCTYSCSSKGALKVHERIHSEERPFKCDVCGFASKQRSNLLLHKKKSHPEKPEKGLGGGGKAGRGGAKCRVAGVAGEPPRPAAAAAAAGSRYRAKLEAARAFCCDLCDASFVREDSLRSHRKQHRAHAQGPAHARPLAPYGSAQLKIIVSHPLGQDGPLLADGGHHPGKPGVVLLRADSQEVVVSSMIQQVSLLAPMQPALSPLEHQAVLLSQLEPEDDSLHQALLQATSPPPQEPCGASQTFITTCTDLEGLSALIREGGTEVTVVTDGDAGAVAKQQQQACRGGSAVPGEGGGGFLVPNISLAGPGMVIHGLPLMVSAHTQPMEHLYSDTHGMDSLPQ